MARTVKVNLDVDEQPYVRGVQRAEHATERLDDAVDDLGGTAKTTTAGMGRAKDSIGGVGTKARTTTRDLDRLGEQIRETELRVKALGDQIRRSGGDADLLKRFGAERSQLARLRAVRRVLGEIGDAAQDAAKFSLRGLTGAIESLPQQLKGAVIISAAGAAMAATPAIGAALTGAIVGAVSTGAIAAGIAGAARSPEVKAAWDDLAAEGKNAFIVFSQPFIEPTVQAIGILQAALVDMRTDIGLIGQDASRLVEPLTRGVAGFVRSLTPGLRSLVREAGPVFDMFEDELPRVGRALGDFFADLGDGAEGGADALRAFLRVVEFSLEGLGEWFKFLSDIIEGADFISSTMGGALNSLFEKGPKVEEMGGIGETSFRRFEDAADDAGKKVRDFNDAIQDAFDKTLNLAQANVDAALGMIDLRRELRDNNATVKDATERGLLNEQALLRQITAIDGVRDAAIDEAGGVKSAVDTANAAFELQLDAIRKVGVEAGISATRMDELIDQFRVPERAVTFRINFVQSGKPVPGVGFGRIR
ncbi:MAG TPA: hypothetical protein VFY84_11055, partial [Jiangellales bacterium]|nr:hypothetical protein [Jiangellales bacterium]